MSKDTELGSDTPDPGDVEILEVVGIDEDDDPEARDERAPDDGGCGEVSIAFGEPARLEASTHRLAGEDEPGAAEEPDLDLELVRRLRADYDNLVKRVERERAEFRVQTGAALLGRLLPVLDNFERALSVECVEPTAAALRDGVVMIYDQLVDELRAEGLRTIASVGQPFDPTVHDAVATEAAADRPVNTVVEELQRGYLFQDRVLRPALVKVAVPDPADGPDGGEA